MEKANLKKRIIAIGCVGAVLIGTGATALYHNAGDVEAKTTAFHAISKYQNNTGLKILEITPTDDDVDLGYWVEKNHRTPASKDASYGNLFLKRITTTSSTTTTIDYSLTLSDYTSMATTIKGTTEYTTALDLCKHALYNQYKAENTWYSNTYDQFIAANILNWYGVDTQKSEEKRVVSAYLTANSLNYSADAVVLAMHNELNAGNLPSAGGGGGVDQVEDMGHALLLRRYGLIKPSGATLKISGLHEYPWWDTEDKGLFSMTNKNGDVYTKVTVPSGTITRGWYEYNTTNSGKYRLAGGYDIGPKTLNPDVSIDAGGVGITELDEHIIYKTEFTNAWIAIANPTNETTGNPVQPTWLTPVNGNTGALKFVEDANNRFYACEPATIENKVNGTWSAVTNGDYTLKSGYYLGQGAGIRHDISETNISTESTVVSADGSIAAWTDHDHLSDTEFYFVEDLGESTTEASKRIYRFTQILDLDQAFNYTPGSGDYSFTASDSGAWQKTISAPNTEHRVVWGYYTANTSPSTVPSTGVTYNIDASYGYVLFDDGQTEIPGYVTGDIVAGQNNTPVTYNFYSKSAVTMYTRVDETQQIPSCIEIADDGHGNLDFKFLPNYPGPYGGYPSDEDLYFNTGSNKWYAVDNWLAEYILGDAQMGYGITYNQMSIQSDSAADIVTAIKNYDLIYFSGTADEYAALGTNVDKSIVKTIYEESAINHKAVMMDYALYSNPSDVSTSTNIDKLCYLLWQEDQLAAGK